MIESGGEPNDYGKASAIDWSSYGRILLTEWRIMAWAALLFGVVSTVYFSFIPNSYQTEIQLLIERMGEVEKVNTQAVTADFRGEDDYYGTQIVLLTSRKILDKLHEEFGASRVPFQLSARRLRGTRILGLTAVSADPELAARVANRAVELYTQDKIQDDLFVQKQMLKWIPAQASPEGAAGARLSAEGLESAPGADESLGGDSGDSWTVLEKDVVYQQLRKDLLSASSQLSQMSSKYKSGHPLVKELKEKIAYTDEQMKLQKERLLEEVKATLGGQMHLTNVKILFPAEIPSRPTSPRRLRGIIMAALLGWMLGLAYILYTEKTDRHIWHESDLNAAVDVPFMGYIPVIPSLVLKGKKSLTLQKVVQSNPLLMDAVALIRTHLLFSAPYDKSRILMMVSTIPNEGKSTVMALLSMSVGSLGKKILVIDADMRRPYLHVNLGVKNETGLAECLSGEVEAKDVIRPVPESNLNILTAGILKSNPSQLLAAGKLKDLLAELAQNYDRIFIDAPPALYIPDGLIIARYVQGTILVTGAGKIREKALKIMKQKFDRMNHFVVGAVINMANRKTDSYQGKYFKHYKQYYNIHRDGSPIS